MKNKFEFPKLSTEARLSLLESGKSKIEIYGKTPIDHERCDCRPIIRSAIELSQKLRKPVEYLDCPRKKEKDMKKYKVVCENCGEILAFFYNDKPELNNNYCDLHYFTWFDKDGKRGCATVNYNNENKKVNFECHCGNRVIKEPRNTFVDVEIKKNVKGERIVESKNKPVKNFMRYTSFKILKV